MNPHKVYISAIIVLLVLAAIGASAWGGHVRGEAKRDAVIDSQKEQISDLENKISSDQQALKEQLAAIAQQKTQVIQVPSQAPDVLAQLLKQMNPQAAPIQQTAPITKEMAPDAPSAVLTKQNQIDLAEAALSCKQCFLEKSQLQSQSDSQQQIIEKQKVELGVAVKASKGGSVWQRTVRIAKWVAISGAVGYGLGRAGK